MYVRHINSVLNKRGKNVNIEQGRGADAGRRGNRWTTDSRTAAKQKEDADVCVDFFVF